LKARARALLPMALGNAFWLPLFFQDTALPTIAIPAAVVILAPGDHVRVLAAIVASMSAMSMIVPPIAGALSDALRRRGVPRRPVIWTGAAVDVCALVFASQAHGVLHFAGFLLLATMGANVSLAAYQALIPDVIPREAWGLASGIRSVAMLLGTILGFGVAAGTPVPTTFIAVAIAVGAGAFALLAEPEERAVKEGEEERARVSDWNDFVLVFIARAFMAFGLALLMTFVLYFFRDILHAGNPSVGTALVGVASLAGAVVSSIYLGWLSDRVPRKIVVALCGIPMTLAAAGFAITPEPHLMYAYALLFGIGFGGIMSTGWALAIDSVPKLRDVGRDLGIWGIAQNFPQVIAPLAGGWVLTLYGNTEPGYRALFLGAAASFAASSVTVLGVGKRRFIPIWGAPIRILSAIALTAYVHTAYRVRSWGRMSSRRGSSLVVANHQIDLDLMPIFAWAVLTGSMESPAMSASARVMYEPGFMAVRIPWLRALLYRTNLGWLFRAIGLLPVENQLQSRSIARWAYAAHRRHGTLPLDRIFKPAFLETAGLHGRTTADLKKSEYFARAQETYARLSDLQVEFRKEAFAEMRSGIKADLAEIEAAVRSGATFVVTPEGEYTRDGAMLPFRAIWERLEPLADHVDLAAISYDPFLEGRLTQLYRIVPLCRRAQVVAELQAARPVTVSALAAAWLLQHNATFLESEFCAGVATSFAELPGELFVDPMLRRDPAARARDALRGLAALRIIERTAVGYRLADVRRHPQFGEVEDIVAFQARVLAETLEGYARSGGRRPSEGERSA
jgi:MFS family permease